MFLCILVTEVAFLYLPGFFFFLKNVPLHYLFYTVELNLNLHHTLSSFRKKRTEVPTARNVVRAGLGRSGATQERENHSQNQVDLSPSNLLLGHFVLFA